MGHYASEMGYDRDTTPDPMTQFNFEKMGGSFYHMWWHTDCRQIFNMTYDPEKNLDYARRHHYACPALHDTVNPGPLA